MRRADCRRIACRIAGFLAIAATVEATPILPADIVPGASVTGSFSFPVSSSPPDQDPSSLTGRYLVSGSTARMVVEIGGFTFPSDLDGLLVEVNDHFTFDFIHLIATGDQATFPFLTGLPHQNPSLDPFGFFALTFRFPATHLSSDAFPTSIDPLAALPFPGGPTPTGIYQRVDGVSRQSPTSPTPEWLFQFDIDPLTMNLVLNEGVLTGTYSGTVAFVRPGDSTPGAPIPEPSSLILLATGLVGFGARRWRLRRSTPVAS
jgi:PEP-CTERM motif